MDTKPETKLPEPKKVWTEPKVRVFGSVQVLTQMPKCKTPGSGDDYAHNIKTTTGC